MDALQPHMSKETLEYHWGKHHKTYVDNMNKARGGCSMGSRKRATGALASGLCTPRKTAGPPAPSLQLIAGTPLEGAKTLEEVVVASWNNGKPTPVFNNAAQVWNHGEGGRGRLNSSCPLAVPSESPIVINGSLAYRPYHPWPADFFWESMKPNGGGEPTGKLAEAITASFGSMDKFKEEFKNACLTQFGSGWAWLVVNKEKKLQIVKTPNAELPVTQGLTPILTCDVWEHAYYIDHR